MSVPVSPKALALILSYEDLGQPSHWPGGSSGITIGYGYDLGYRSREEYARDWTTHLRPLWFGRLTAALGKRGESARVLAPQFTDIVIEPEAAEMVFRSASLPWAVREATKVFPGLDRLPADAAGALVSLVFNRGPSIDEADPRRAEMDTIHDILVDGVQQGDLEAIACQLRSMKRLWVGKGLNGLVKRREAEAKLVEGAV